VAFTVPWVGWSSPVYLLAQIPGRGCFTPTPEPLRAVCGSGDGNRDPSERVRQLGRHALQAVTASSLLRGLTHSLPQLPIPGEPRDQFSHCGHTAKRDQVPGFAIHHQFR